MSILLSFILIYFISFYSVLFFKLIKFNFAGAKVDFLKYRKSIFKLQLILWDTGKIIPLFCINKRVVEIDKPPDKLLEEYTKEGK